MSNFDSDGGPGNEWEDRGDLAWNEFDWERYLREQDESVNRYLRFYEECKVAPDRIDRVAEKMNWGEDDWSDDDRSPAAEDNTEDASDESFEEDGDDDVYTLHKNPIFIATKAIYLGINRSWLSVAGNANEVPQRLAVAMLATIHRGEDQAVQAIHALDFGDYAMAISLFKRALSELNGSFALMNDENVIKYPRVQAWRDEALPRFFDLREIWLRVMAECREELDRPVDDED